MLDTLVRKFRQSKFLAQALSLVVISIVTITVVGGFHTAPASSTSLIDRLDSLRSTSPESGIYDARSSSFDVAVVDTMISNLQTMTEDCALAMQGTDEELIESASTWHDKLEQTMPVLQQTRRELVARRFDELRSTSPESGI